MPPFSMAIKGFVFLIVAALRQSALVLAGVAL